MENNIVINKPNPHRRANFLSKVTFTWLIQLCSKAVKGNLEVDDLYNILASDKSCGLADRLEKNWNREVLLKRLENKKPNLLRVLRQTFFWSYLFYGLFLFLHIAILRSIQPILLATLINLFSSNEDGNEDNLNGLCLYGGIMLLITFFIIIIDHHSSLMLCRMGMRVRIACSSLVYRKSLRLSQKSIEQTAAGEMINLLSNDVNRFDSVAKFLHHIWIMPILILIVTCFIWQQVQISGLIGVSTLFLLTVPVHLFVGKLMSKLRLKVAQRTDNRIKKMSEIISGIQVIKMYAWERPFEEVVNRVRAQEINALTKVSYLRGIIFCSAVFLERLTLFVTLVVYVLLGNKLTAARVFSVAQFINLAQVSMAIFFPNAISLGAETLISIQRLEEFLLLEEKFLPVITKDESNEIILKNVRASWLANIPILRNVTFKIPQGCLCAIIGPVGVGKSSLLQLLLGELVQELGTIKIGGEISYSSQKPWLFASTIRKNILFGQEYNRELYKTVVRVCALKKDFEQLPQGDKTLIGDKGVALSGGQKARISLARAVYRKADIYLLDDSLSAVDARVGKELFRECIKTYLKTKTRILVTHQLQYLKEVDYIIVLNEGTIEARGTFEELSIVNSDFTEMLKSHVENKENERNKVILRPVENESLISSLSLPSCKMESLKEENEAIASTEKSVFLQYLKFGGNYFFLCLSAFFIIFGQVTANCSDIWLTFWTSRETSWNRNSTSEFVLSRNSAIYVYTSLIVLCIVLFIAGALFCYKIAMIASKNLHNTVFRSLLQAPMRFFDTNPSGRILNRFSRDMGIIDDILPPSVYSAIQVLLVMIGILCLVIFTNPYMIIVVVILAVLFNKLQSCFMIVARQIKHLEGITKSPVFSHISATWNGIITIRAGGMEKQLKNEFDVHQDTHTSSWHLSLIVMTAFGLWLDLISLIFIACVIFGFILMTRFSPVSGSYVDLAVFHSSILTGMVQYGISQIAQAVSQMTSVERVLEYTKLEKEASENLNQYKTLELFSDKNYPLWPSVGKITFSNVTLQYCKTDRAVLKELNFVVKGGEKIGIVGRTGAGKSSLMAALFRLTPIEGTITIDGLNIRDVSLENLRSRISIIPQEPVLFSQTLRYNLDPSNSFTDVEIWKALEEVEMKQVIESLNQFVYEGGSNFSIGQRQLLCLARALIRKNKILILDEATANVDAKTDELIQKSIRDKFKNCTVLTIAHRLNTVMDSDKVMVIDEGVILEFGHAYQLLQNKSGHLFKMAAEADLIQLTAVAKNSYNILISHHVE